MTVVADVASAACLVLGTLLALIAAIGVLRLPDVLTRMHSATKPQVVGLLLLVAISQLVTSPIATHMVGRASFRAGQVRQDLLVVDELTEALEQDDRPD